MANNYNNKRDTNIFKSVSNAVKETTRETFSTASAFVDTNADLFKDISSSLKGKNKNK